jgi:hypothetical protein
MGEGAFEGKQYVHQILYTELKTFVDTQQYLFDNLCSHSVPAKEKIREIGRGFNGDFIDYSDSLRNSKNRYRTNGFGNV